MTAATPDPGASRAGAPGLAELTGDGQVALPSGTVTFLFTDIEGSTRLLESLGAARYEPILDEHRRRIREGIAAGGGREIGTDGDAVFAAFASASGAVAATVVAQRLLAEPIGPGGEFVRVRMGLHTGEATLAGQNYVGLEVHRAARIGAAAHGGQVLLSASTRAIAEGSLPAGVSLRDLGEHRLKDLSRAERLAQLVIAGLVNDFPPPRTLDATPNNLPIQLTSFVGRRDLVQEATRLLEGTRLLTLTGPGGTGKTRLALEVAAGVADRFPDGVFFAPLAPLADPTLVAPTIATAAGIAQMGGGPPLDHLVETLKSRKTLIVLDNFEQLLGAASDIGRLLRGTESLKVMVTSRSPLRISGEQELPVPPMGLPDQRVVHGAAALSQYDAVRLFIERALMARPDFQVTNENAPAVAEITARLDGLPLAIELAAARLRLLSPQAILARLGDRLALLSGGSRDLPERQQTLRAAIAWSYDLLEPGERDLFERLAVFMGGWTFEAAEAVVAALPSGIDVLDGLGSLNDKSLIRAVQDQHGDPRFLMLETIHAYATERFTAGPDADVVRRAHADWFHSFVDLAAAEIGRGERKAALERLEDDYDNVRAALDFLMRTDLPAAARLAGSLWRFWQMRGYLDEGKRRIESIIATDDRDHLLAPGDRRRVLTAAGGIAYWQGDMSAHAYYREALDLARAHGTRAELADALYDFSFAPVPSDDVAGWTVVLGKESPKVIDQAIQIYRDLGDEAGVARALWASADFRFYGGDIAGAEREVQEALPIFRRLGDRFGAAWAIHELSLFETVTGRLPAAEAYAREAMDMFRTDGDISGMNLALVDFAGIAETAGDRSRALRLVSAAGALAKRNGVLLASFSWTSPPFPFVPSAPNGAAEQSAWDEGARMDLETAVAYALEPVAEAQA